MNEGVSFLWLTDFTDDAPFFLDDIGPTYSGEKCSSPNPSDDPVLSYMRRNNNERENEELRGIIDDLTLDIKGLKQKLRKYKERDPPQLQRDKLFDVRTYGLSRRRKRQLERILQRFAADISASPRFSRDRQTTTKSKRMGNNVLISGDDGLEALVAMLFKHRLSLVTKTSQQDSANASSSSDSWYDVNEILTSVKHTISAIDVGFIREALKEYGTPLELSADGCSVRWETSNQHGLVRRHMWSNLMYDHIHNDQTSIHQEMVLGLAESNTTALQKPAASSYVPYISGNRATEADDEILSMVSSSSEICLRTSASDAGGEISTTRSQPQTNFQGRSTYYKNATFYIDCSGDRTDVKDSQQRTSTWTEVGEKRTHQSSFGLSRRQQRPYTTGTAADRFLSYPTEKDVALNLSQCSSSAMSLVEEPLTSMADGYKAFPKELPVSGIGDVVPDDNFAVHVVMKHVPMSPSDDTGGGINHNTSRCKDTPCQKTETSRLSHPSFQDAITCHNQGDGKINNKSKNKPFRTYAVTATREELAPSSLPPATCGIFSLTSSDDDDGGDDDGEDGDDESDGDYGNQGEMRYHDLSRELLARVGVVAGESPASVHSIERWNAQVVASLGNHEDNRSS